MLKLENINITFNKNTANERKALQHIDLDVADGDFVTVIGSNGAGKSTMINLITDNVSRDKMNGGSILFGEDSAEEDILKLGNSSGVWLATCRSSRDFMKIFRLKHFLNIWQRLRELRGLRRLMTMAMRLLRLSTSR